MNQARNEGKALTFLRNEYAAQLVTWRIARTLAADNLPDAQADLTYIRNIICTLESKIALLSRSITRIK